MYLKQISVLTEDDEETHQLQPPSKWKKSDGKGKPGNKTTSQASDISSTDTCKND